MFHLTLLSHQPYWVEAVILTVQMRNTEVNNCLADGRTMVQIQAAGRGVPAPDHSALLLILRVRSRQGFSGILTRGWRLHQARWDYSRIGCYFIHIYGWR